MMESAEVEIHASVVLFPGCSAHSTAAIVATRGPIPTRSHHRRQAIPAPA